MQGRLPEFLEQIAVTTAPPPENPFPAIGGSFVRRQGLRIMMTLEQYLTPDPSLRAPRPEPDSLPDTLPSLSSRQISLHSAISVHGWDFFDGRKLWYEAELELTFARLAKMRPDVAGIAEQPPAAGAGVVRRRLGTLQVGCVLRRTRVRDLREGLARRLLRRGGQRRPRDARRAV
jgi:hypothetical protein